MYFSAQTNYIVCDYNVIEGESGY